MERILVVGDGSRCSYFCLKKVMRGMKMETGVALGIMVVRCPASRRLSSKMFVTTTQLQHMSACELSRESKSALFAAAKALVYSLVLPEG